MKTVTHSFHANLTPVIEEAVDEYDALHEKSIDFTDVSLVDNDVSRIDFTDVSLSDDDACHGVGRDINVQCVLIEEMIIIVGHYTLAVRNRR
jgi:hypothetical protein